jgi:hypothetical protein
MNVKVADEVWIATALLHNEYPERTSFTQSDIVDRVAKENIFGRIRPGIMIHASIHCVANKKPNPGNYRMLYATKCNDYSGSDKCRRLFKESDDYHPWREGGKIMPRCEDMPEKYHYLIEWWKKDYNEK